MKNINEFTYGQLIELIDREHSKALDRLRREGHDTAGLQEAYETSMQDFRREMDRDIERLNQEREGKRRTFSLKEKIGLVALATVLGSGLYVNSLVTHTEDQSFNIMGGVLSTAGIIGGIGLAYKLRKIFRERNKPK